MVPPTTDALTPSTLPDRVLGRGPSAHEPGGNVLLTTGTRGYEDDGSPGAQTPYLSSSDTGEPLPSVLGPDLTVDEGAPSRTEHKHPKRPLCDTVADLHVVDPNDSRPVPLPSVTQNKTETVGDPYIS